MSVIESILDRISSFGRRSPHELRRIREGFPDLLAYSFLVEPGVVMLKDGALLMGWNFSGPDPETASPRELELLAFHVNKALSHLGDGWMAHISSFRLPSSGYPTAEFPDATSAVIDFERREGYEAAGSRFENISSIFLTYKPPTAVDGLARKLFIEGAERTMSRDEQVRTIYLSKIEHVEDALSVALNLERMGSTELLTMLHACVTGVEHPILVPEVPMHLDYLLGSQDFTTGFYPKIGDNHIVQIGLSAFPDKSYPELLSSIVHAPTSFRYTTRFIFLDRETAQAKIDKRRAYWEQLRLRKADVLARVVKVPESGHVNRHADDMMEDALEALHEASGTRGVWGHFTATATLFGPDRAAVLTHAREIIKEFNRKGVSARIETFNAVESFLGSLPGHGYQNVRKPLMFSTNLAHLSCLSSLWPGLETHPSPLFPPGSPPHVVCATAGATPFRLNLHVSDVGSTLVIGPTGSGKTVLLNALISQFFKYDGAQVFCFDKGYGAYVLGEASGAQHYDVLGPHGEDVSFCPLDGVADANERVWAVSWLETLLELQGVKVSPERRQLLVQALKRLGESDSRTLTELLVQDQELKAGLKYYELGGGSGGILDARADSLQKGRFQIFELEHLMSKGEKLVVPVLLYLFHRIQQRLDGRPTLIVIDEAWVMLMNALAAEQVEEWLRVVRKNNAAVVLATQSLLEVERSSLREILYESCPTKIFLPNPEATSANSRAQYLAVGMSDKQIETLAYATPKREYYYWSPLGSRLFSLDLGPVSLSFIGVNGKTNREAVEQLKNEHGDQWCAEWLRARGHTGHAHLWEQEYFKRRNKYVSNNDMRDSRVMDLWRYYDDRPC